MVVASEWSTQLNSSTFTALSVLRWINIMGPCVQSWLYEI
jgi:hypothetical protein